jgi:uncharacterized membrane protein
MLTTSKLQKEYTTTYVPRSNILVSFLRTPKLLKNLDARPRLIISIVVAGLVCILVPNWLKLPTRIIISWNSGVVCFLALAWSMMFGATPQKMRRSAKAQDESGLGILTLVVAAACISLFAIGVMLKNTKDLSVAILTLHVTMAGITVICSWLLIHTMFALHYAHYYYRDDSQAPPDDNTKSLDFPNENQPDYWDFLYFSFVIGMTCQVADVSITSRATRQLALVHGVLTFFFNTVILAISINIIAGLI